MGFLHFFIFFNFLSFRFEYCSWRHNGQLCKFEWKRSSNAVLMQFCRGMHSRVKYVGNYTAHECEIEVSNVSSDDSGVWSCDVESYILGANRGYKAQKELTLTIKSPTITTIATTMGKFDCNDFSLIQFKVFRSQLLLRVEFWSEFQLDLLRIPLPSAFLTKF